VETFARGYLANGMLIAAALALGFPARPTDPDSPNAYFNISLKLSTAHCGDHERTTRLCL
jgi:hypothetical protein